MTFHGCADLVSKQSRAENLLTIVVSATEALRKGYTSGDIRNDLQLIAKSTECRCLSPGTAQVCARKCLLSS